MTSLSKTYLKDNIYWIRKVKPSSIHADSFNRMCNSYDSFHCLLIFSIFWFFFSNWKWTTVKAPIFPPHGNFPYFLHAWKIRSSFR
jgi:hypothetical protein